MIVKMDKAEKPGKMVPAIKANFVMEKRTVGVVMDSLKADIMKANLKKTCLTDGENTSGKTEDNTKANST